MLQEEYDRQKQEGFCIENVDGMTNFVFTNRFGMPHNPAAVNRAIKRIVDTHNSEEEVAAKKEKREPIMIPRFSCHIFRHTFASRFCENETNIKVIQEVMGHADVSTTMNIYAEANPETNCQGLFNQIHRKLTKGARSTVWLLTPHLTDYIFPFSRSLQRYA